MPDDYKSLKERLEAALKGFPTKKTLHSKILLRSEHDAVTKISFVLKKMYGNIVTEERKLRDLLEQRNEYEQRIRCYLDRIRTSIFKDLMKYKISTEKNQIDIIDNYSVIQNEITAISNNSQNVKQIDEHNNLKHENEYQNSNVNQNIIYNNQLEKTSKPALEEKMSSFEESYLYIRKILRVFKKSIETDEFLLSRLSDLKKAQDDGHFGDVSNLKTKGLDPRLYKYYSSSDENTIISSKSEESTKYSIEKKDIIDSRKIYENNQNEELIDVKENSENDLNLVEFGPLFKDFNEEELKGKIENIIEKREIDDADRINEKVEEAKSEIQKMEESTRFDLETKHGARERIHYIIKKLNLSRIDTSKKLMEKLQDRINQESETKVKLESDKTKEKMLSYEEERIKSILMKMYKEINRYNKNNDVAENECKQKISGSLLKMSRNLLEDKNKINDFILSSVGEVVCQGTLEDDLRFLAKLDRQLKDIEEKSEPRFFKISVNMEIAKKYVKDIIHLKKKNLLIGYYDVR